MSLRLACHAAGIVNLSKVRQSFQFHPFITSQFISGWNKFGFHRSLCISICSCCTPKKFPKNYHLHCPKRSKNSHDTYLHEHHTFGHYHYGDGYWALPIQRKQLAWTGAGHFRQHWHALVSSPQPSLRSRATFQNSTFYTSSDPLQWPQVMTSVP